MNNVLALNNDKQKKNDNLSNKSKELKQTALT